MDTRKIQFILSALFIISYLSILTVIIYAEMSGMANNISENSLMGEFKVLLGVLTASVAQILNYWFSLKKEEIKQNSSKT